jgi:hypothetical protein
MSNWEKGGNCKKTIVKATGEEVLTYLLTYSMEQSPSLEANQ